MTNLADAGRRSPIPAKDGIISENVPGSGNPFVCDDGIGLPNPSEKVFGNQQIATTKMPTVLFRKPNLTNHLHVTLTERGMDGKADRVLWDAEYFDPWREVVGGMLGHMWNFLSSVPIGGNKIVV
jgi:hypothetical protein